jgi:catechol 1,2-dioxygenase
MTKAPFFTEANSEDVVISRAGPQANVRMKQITESLVRHLHAFVKETEPTMQEWMQGIQFLTRTGHLSTDWRQEFILLSDVLGVSMLVETINNRKTSGETESTVLGPFHVSNAPRYANGANICLDGKGEPVWVSGTVRDVDGQPIQGALLDVWQANEDGFYDVQQKGIQPDNNLRGIFTSDAQGHYSFRSAYPRYYPIPFDGTVGDVLKALDRNPNRPAHLHFIVSADGFKAVTTHIFTPECPWLKDDAVFGVKESLIADFRKVDDPARARELGLGNPFREVTWDFVLSRLPPSA